MSKPPLGRLEKISPSVYWENEAVDFTPWLAQDETIKLLGDTIGLDLEVHAQEMPVGPYRADILCRNINDNTLVLIENQLERTDHSHLGQIFTYAAGLDAVTVIWVAQRFSEEHRAALDWLNRITQEGINFFGIEIELFRIGKSDMAPHFKLVSKPNEWSKTRIQPPLTSTEELQIAYWTSFASFLIDNNASFKPLPAKPRTYISYGIGRSGCEIGATVSMHDQRWVYVWLYLDGPNADTIFRLLESDRERIEEQIGYPLTWEERPERKSRMIASYLQRDPSDRTIWLELHAWMLNRLKDFERVFRPRLKALTFPESVNENGEITLP